MSALRELVRDRDSGTCIGVLASQRAQADKHEQAALLNQPSERTYASPPRAFSSRRGGILVAGMLAVAGAFFVWQALLLDLGGVASPGPGFLPLLLGALILVAAALIAIECRRSPERETVELGHRDVLITIVALLAVPLLFDHLGAYIPLALLAIVLLVLIGRIAILIAIPATAFGLMLCWFFFQVLLGLQLPSGPW